MKTLFKAILFSVAFMPLAAFSQTNTAEVKPKSAATTPSPNTEVDDKSDNNSGQGHYKVSKRNKKVGKMKYEICETKEIEKGTRKGEIKTVCEPVK